MAQSSELWYGQVPSVVSCKAMVPSFVPLYGMVPLFLVTVRYGAVVHVTYHGMVTYTYFVLSFNGLVPSFISRATIWCRVPIVSRRRVVVVLDTGRCDAVIRLLVRA